MEINNNKLQLGAYAKMLVITSFLGMGINVANAQLPMGTTRNNTTSDTSSKKTNTSDWEDENTEIYCTKNNSQIKLFIDSSIHSIHRRPFSQPWNRDLGNLGSPIRNLQFVTQNPIGPSLGYHNFDAYRFVIDSLDYYNTTKPYTDFKYNLGSKLEQIAQILHTQNIKPNWNIALCYRKTSSPGYYFIQRNNDDNAYLTTNYKSLSQNYKLNAAITYNKFQHDENGGIVSDTFLNNPQYADRKAIPVRFYNPNFNSSTRSPVTNTFRDFTLLIDHSYTWGKRDTTYNTDSTQYTALFTPRFGFSHRLELGSQRYQFKDLRPDSLRYTIFFNKGFASTDSVFTRQEWFYLDNRFLLNGFVGKRTNQLSFNGGIGNRIDNFSTKYIVGNNSTHIFSNYLIGALNKDASQPQQWNFSANVQLFLTGDAAGNFLLNAMIAKDFGKSIGYLKIGALQQLNNAPYSYTTYQNRYWLRNNSFNKESNTQLYAQLINPKYQVSAGVKNYLLSNYLYFDASQNPQQAATAFSITQVWLRKIFQFGNFVLDNELIYQEQTNAAPVNIPRLMGRHQLSIETYVFKRQLKIATGVELRYHSNYFANGYAPLLNQFYYQNSYLVSNPPSASLFFNFKIKRFRSYVMFDQVQQLFVSKNQIISEAYAAQNAMLRFGFSWVLIN